MMRMIATAAMAMLVAAAAAGEGRNAGPTTAPAGKSDKHIDLVICLDTSNSMDGLVESAKTKLWAVVNELALAKPRPALRVALFQYGNDNLDAKTGWIERLSDLTGDLDLIYSKLFALKTGGGTEYVAGVIRSATETLSWNMDKGTLRVIFVAGNEPATQDKEHPLQEMCKAAASKGIIVNTIYCDDGESGGSAGWAEAAHWADGQYATINQDKGTVTVATPYDRKLADLSVELNGTYVAFGDAGAAGHDRQMAMESAAAGQSGSTHAERALAKSSGLYRNEDWDLVDAVKAGKKKAAALDGNEVPDEMKKMSPTEREAYVAGKAKRREEIQKEIKDLSAKRETHIKDEMAKRGLSDKQAFDAALRGAIRKQAEQKEFKFEK